MPHDSADRASREAAGCWAFSEMAHKARAAVDAFPQRPALRHPQPEIPHRRGRRAAARAAAKRLQVVSDVFLVSSWRP
jgi:hypothetical protein